MLKPEQVGLFWSMWVIYNNASALYNHFPFLVWFLLIRFLISEPGFSVVGAPFLHFRAGEFRGGCGSSATLAPPRCAVLLLCQLVARALRCAPSVTGAGPLPPAWKLGVEKPRSAAGTSYNWFTCLVGSKGNSSPSLPPPLGLEGSSQNMSFLSGSGCQLLNFGSFFQIVRAAVI